MLPLPSFAALSWSTKLVILLGVILATNIFTAKFVNEHVSTKYENILLQQKVSVVTVERKVEVLDKATLQRRLDEAKAKWEREQTKKDLINEVITNRENSVVPWCELSADELRLWNCENTDFADDSCKELTGRGKLPTSTPSGERKAEIPVVEQK